MEKDIIMDGVDVEKILNSMTLEEKVSQLVHDSPAIKRLGIKKYNWWNECLHGVARAGLATVFPQTIGIAATWNDNLVLDIANAISNEARAKHHEFDRQGKNEIYQGLTYWSPNINIFRDPRWGRGMETYGEDPYLTSALAVPFIKGLQGDHPKYLKLIATPKHFAVHSGPEDSRHTFNATPSNIDLWETYLPAFEACIKEGGAYSIMGAYNRLYGEACTASDFLLKTILREKWKFEGYTVSDAGAITDIAEHHKITTSLAEAAALALKSGTDLCAGTEYLHLVEAIEKGFITEEELNISVSRLLKAKKKLGLLANENGNPYSKIPFDIVNCKHHQDLALQVARESIVLLKNEDALLPLSKKLNKIAVIGPNANETDIHLGNYHGTPYSLVSLYQGIKNKLGATCEVVYEQGCELAEGLPTMKVLTQADTYTDDTKGFSVKYFNNSKFSGTPIQELFIPEFDLKLFDNLDAIVTDTDNFGIIVSCLFIPQESGQYAFGVQGLTAFELFINDCLLTSFNTIWEPEKVYGLVDLEKDRKYDITLRISAKTSESHVQKLLWAMPDKDMHQRAIDLALSSDVIVLGMGLSPQLEGEEMPVLVEGFNKGDRSSLDLPQSQTKFIKDIVRLGKPVVLVLFNGCALSINWEKDNVPAIIEAWYGGQSAGSAVADVLFGDFNPSGKLPITFYKSVEQLPAFDDYSMKNRTYRFFKEEVLFGFGFGLSYSKFLFSDLDVVSVNNKHNFIVSVKVKNGSSITGTVVVQLYVSRVNPSDRYPLKSLQKFKKIILKPSEEVKVEFLLSSINFSIIDEDANRTVEKGQFKIFVGESQPNTKEENSKILSTIVNVAV